ncbi:hypothetical protein [Burkholderia ubonensis]|uniref:hypothetical protein n=1 Tax=Burkholderia ubonensis TaxID=101571 RepID=UPI0018DFB348|nr:hypothetical protein [Burkholderia ubonensis]
MASTALANAATQHDASRDAEMRFTAAVRFSFAISSMSASMFREAFRRAQTISLRNLLRFPNECAMTIDALQPENVP